MALLQTQISFAQDAAVTDNHYITVDDVTLHYRTGGSGPYLLLLHGFTLSGEQWTLFLDRFAKDFTVIAMDMPGHGRSDMLQSRFSFEKWAALMLKMLDQMGIENVKAIGHSAGAITLLHMAAQNPEIINSMILVDGAHLYTEDAREELRHDSFEKAPDGLREYYMDIHYGDREKIEALFDDINYMADQIPVDPDQAVLNEQVLSGITIPVLLVWGDRDFYFPIQTAVELYNLLPDASLWVIPEQGHTPVWAFMGGDSTTEKIFPEKAAGFLNRLEK